MKFITLYDLTGREGFINRHRSCCSRSEKFRCDRAEKPLSLLEMNVWLMSDSSANSTRTRGLKLSFDAMFESLVWSRVTLSVNLKLYILLSQQPTCRPVPAQYLPNRSTDLLCLHFTQSCSSRSLSLCLI